MLNLRTLSRMENYSWKAEKKHLKKLLKPAGAMTLAFCLWLV